MPLPPFLQRFRSRSPVPAPAPLSSADIEQARVSARRRMIGMAVLVGAGVIGFPWLFETQPRPLSPDLQLVNAASSPSAAVAAVSGAAPRLGASAAPTEPAPRPALIASTAKPAESLPQEEILASPEPSPEPSPSVVPFSVDTVDASPVAVPVTQVATAAPAQTPAVASKPTPVKPLPKTEQPKPAPPKPVPPKPVPPKPALPKVAPSKPVVAAKPVPVKPPVAKPEPAKAVASKAPAPPEDTRYIVQIGAFSDSAAAHTTRMKVERLGIKTYTQAVDTPAGKKIRVRIGPYASKQEADKAMATLRKAGITGGLLTL